MAVLTESRLPLPLLRKGKVREVYEVDADHLLLVASDRVSAFDIVMAEPIPRKGAVLTQLSAFWFERLAGVTASHYVTADTDQIIERVPELEGVRSQVSGRAMLVLRTNPVAFECVVRGYISGSAWNEYRDHGTLAGEKLAPGLVQSSRLEPPIFSPATKAESGHDINVTFDAVAKAMGAETATRLRDLSFEVYRAGGTHASERGIIIADTKFEFGFDQRGALRLIDEVMTPDSSRFWPVDSYRPGTSPPSYDKQFVRDYLETLSWNKRAPGPSLPADIIAKTSSKYEEAFKRLTS